MSKNKTIRFFISSTFKDFEAERNILQKFVFPKLKELCNKNRFGFQPIDLRWGIQEEAGLSQQTMNICLNEIKRSSFEPMPNLLLLVGQRYGWIPLPYEIKEKEFDKIIKSNKLPTKNKTLINEWYEKDKNSKDNIFYLKDKHHLSRDEWSLIEKQLRNVLQESVDESFSDDLYQKVQTSATEQEMSKGLDAFDKGKSHEHTFAYFRTIKNYDINNEKVKEYIDKDLTKLKKLSKKLKKDSNIPEENQIKQENVKWDEIENSKNILYENLTLENSPKYLQEFYNKILEKFTISIQKEIDNFKEKTELQLELKQQENFLKEKSEIVLGRDAEVERIKSFIKDNTEQFYLQYGKSGSGKTSVIAKAISEINTKEYEVYYRFIGTTASSTYSRVLFENIYWQIEANLNEREDIPKPHIETEERKFKKQFKEQFKKIKNKKVIIFLDALDQFEDYNNLTILLNELPINIKIVFSTLYDEEKKDNPDYSQYYNKLEYLEKKYELIPLEKSTNKEILDAWLDSKNRKLTDNQWNKINTFIQDVTPLHLRLIFEIVKQWKSEQSNLHLENTEEKLIIQFFDFVQKEYHHEDSLLEHTLGYISASKDGLSEEELIDLFSNDKLFLETFQNHRYPKLDRLPNAIWSRFYYYIKPFFTEKLIDNEMLIKPYHRIIEEVIKEKYYTQRKMIFHDNLANFFYFKQDKKLTWDKRYYSFRMLSELPYQFLQSKNSWKLKEILFDLEFAGSIYNNGKQDSFIDIISKATSLDAILEDEIYPWKSFFREKEYLILKLDEVLWKPHQSLFQLAYEDGIDSPLTKKAESLIKNNKTDFNWIRTENRGFFRRDLFYIVKSIFLENEGIESIICNDEGIYLTVLKYNNEDKTYKFDFNLNKLVDKRYKSKTFYKQEIQIEKQEIQNFLKNDKETFEDIIAICNEYVYLRIRVKESFGDYEKGLIINKENKICHEINFDVFSGIHMNFRIFKKNELIVIERDDLTICNMKTKNQKVFESSIHLVFIKELFAVKIDLNYWDLYNYNFDKLITLQAEKVEHLIDNFIIYTNSDKLCVFDLSNMSTIYKQSFNIDITNISVRKSSIYISSNNELIKCGINNNILKNIAKHNKNQDLKVIDDYNIKNIPETSLLSLFYTNSLNTQILLIGACNIIKILPYVDGQKLIHTEYSISIFYKGTLLRELKHNLTDFDYFYVNQCLSFDDGTVIGVCEYTYLMEEKTCILLWKIDDDLPYINKTSTDVDISIIDNDKFLAISKNIVNIYNKKLDILLTLEESDVYNNVSVYIFRDNFYIVFSSYLEIESSPIEDSVNHKIYNKKHSICYIFNNVLDYDRLEFNFAIKNIVQENGFLSFIDHNNIYYHSNNNISFKTPNLFNN